MRAKFTTIFLSTIQVGSPLIFSSLPHLFLCGLKMNIIIETYKEFQTCVITNPSRHIFRLLNLILNEFWYINVHNPTLIYENHLGMASENTNFQLEFSTRICFFSSTSFLFISTFQKFNFPRSLVCFDFKIKTNDFITQFIS